MNRIVVVNNHDVVRKGDIDYLEKEDDFNVIGEASSGDEGVDIVLKEAPDVVLMDLIMENGNGIEATKRIKDVIPDCKVIVLTSYYDDKQIFPALEAGAFSYLLKTATAEEIVSAIKKAHHGENRSEERVAHKVMNRFQDKQPTLHDQLTDLVVEVLNCVVNGSTNQEISDKLFIGIKTFITKDSNIL